MKNKKENIAEYILYLWQLEDYLRAFPEQAEGNDELTDVILRWMQQNTVSGRFSMPYASENRMNFTQVRIPVYDDYGVAIDAYAFARSLSKMLRREPYQIPSKVLVKGLGRAVIVLGEK